MNRVAKSRRSSHGRKLQTNTPHPNSMLAESLLALEPRYLFDAAGAAMGAEVAADVVAEQQADEAFTAESTATDLAPAAGSSGTQSTSDELLGALAGYEAPSERVEIIFIDPSVEDAETLIAGVDPNALVIMLDPDQDGVEQIANVLSQYDGVDAVHIVAHGDAGSLQLGNTVLTQDTINGEHADELAAIGAALGDDADILIYGCNFGQGTLGRGVAEQFAGLTGADIAASDDLTGNAELGGDWDLEVQVGQIETASAFSTQAMNDFQSLLLLTFHDPIAEDDDGGTIDEDTSVVIDVLDNDSDPEIGSADIRFYFCPTRRVLGPRQRHGGDQRRWHHHLHPE